MSTPSTRLTISPPPAATVHTPVRRIRSTSAEQTATTGGGRLASLDILRAAAIFLVLGRHTVAEVAGLGPLTPVAALWTRIGWSGVDLFFVLSGFLVSGLLFSEYSRTGAVNVRRFVIRRGFKIWPPYLVYVGFVACWLAWKHHRDGGAGVWTQIWPNLLHVQNYFHTPRIHTWSLAVEEHFYLVVALAFYWLLSGRRAATLLRYFPYFVVCAVGGLAAVRTLAYQHAGGDGMNIYATHLRFDGLLIGTLLSYLSFFHPRILAPLARHPVALMCVGLVLAAPTLLLAPEANAWTAGIGLTGVYLGYALVLWGWLNLEAQTRFGRALMASRGAAVLAAVGFYSYSIYLWHIDLAQTPLKKLAAWTLAHGWSPGAAYVAATSVYVVVAIVAGRIMASLLEKPSLAMRERFFPSRIKAVAGSTGA